MAFAEEDGSNQQHLIPFAHGIALRNLILFVKANSCWRQREKAECLSPAQGRPLLIRCLEAWRGVGMVDMAFVEDR